MHRLYLFLILLNAAWSLTSPKLFKGNLKENERQGPIVKVHVSIAMEWIQSNLIVVGLGILGTIIVGYAIVYKLKNSSSDKDIIVMKETRRFKCANC
ncbi:unnamed protein product [Blepharisma stoltei]|uniref:Uncharacterized protein n=1 Tax=Blepharisma stoltei TaxID=1481888 RepID=A0AAU9JQK4_9CILI|nr:unnamed protein product [Blepharisma stoltei]